MEGVILGFNSTTKTGVIKTSDDKRYKFSASDFQDNCTIQKGLKVDFLVNTTGIATEIYTIENKEDLSVNERKNNLFSCPHCTSENTEKLSYFYFKNLALINQTSQTRTETRGQYNQYKSSSVSSGNSQGTIQSAILNKMQLESLETFIERSQLPSIFYFLFSLTIGWGIFFAFLVMNDQDEWNEDVNIFFVFAIIFFLMLIFKFLFSVNESFELKTLERNCLENNMSEYEFMRKIESIIKKYNKVKEKRVKAKKYYHLVNVWKQLFLCHRCDTIFIPEINEYASINELKTFVNKIASRK